LNPAILQDRWPDGPIPTGVAVLLLILLMAWQFAGENVLPAIALAILALALAAFCPEPS
jgi:hypothetical protein